MTFARARDRREERLASQGYILIRQAVPQDAVDDARRILHLDWLERGVSAEEMGRWLHEFCWFPHLRWSEPILALAGWIPEVHRIGEMAEPQILLQFPDSAGRDVPLEPHLDQPPPWAKGRAYSSIVGVALSRNHPANGGLRVWPLDGRDVQALTLEAGDLVVMHPRLPHSAGVNKAGDIRYAVYFRFLQSNANTAENVFGSYPSG